MDVQDIEDSNLLRRSIGTLDGRDLVGNLISVDVQSCDADRGNSAGAIGESHKGAGLYQRSVGRIPDIRFNAGVASVFGADDDVWDVGNRVTVEVDHIEVDAV